MPNLERHNPNSVRGANRASRAVVVSDIFGPDVLAGCDPSVQVSGPIAYGGLKAPLASPETIKKEVSAFGHAHVIVMAYPDGFRDNEAARGELQSLLMQAAALQGFASLSASQIVLSIASREESRAIVLGYERQRGIVLEDRNSWCAAGQYEGAHHFVVGKYLIAK